MLEYTETIKKPETPVQEYALDLLQNDVASARFLQDVCRQAGLWAVLLIVLTLRVDADGVPIEAGTLAEIQEAVNEAYQNLKPGQLDNLSA